MNENINLIIVQIYISDNVNYADDTNKKKLLSSNKLPLNNKEEYMHEVESGISSDICRNHP